MYNIYIYIYTNICKVYEYFLDHLGCQQGSKARIYPMPGEIPRQKAGKATPYHMAP